MEKKDKNNLIAIVIFLGIIAIIGIFNAEPWRNARQVKKYIKERTVSTEYALPENISSQEEFDATVMDLMLWAEKQYSDMESLAREAHVYSKKLQLKEKTWVDISKDYIDKVEDDIIKTFDNKLEQLCAGGEYGKYVYNSRAGTHDYYRAVKSARDIVEKQDYRNASFNVGNIYVVLGEDSACLHAIARFYPDFYAIWEVNHQQVINERYGKKEDKNEDKKTNNTSTSTSTKPTYSTKKTHDTYDEGYEDVWLDGEPDWDRYESDPDYALGVDDAMDEFDW